MISVDRSYESSMFGLRGALVSIRRMAQTCNNEGASKCPGLEVVEKAGESCVREVNEPVADDIVEVRCRLFPLEKVVIEIA